MCYENYLLEACCWGSKWILIPSWYQEAGEWHNGSYWRVSEEEVSQSLLFSVQSGLCFLPLVGGRGVDLPNIVVLQESQPGSGANVSIATSWQEACSSKWLFWEEEEKRTKVGKKSCKGCTSCRCSLLLPGRCRPGCAIWASAPSTLPKQPPCRSLRHSWTPMIFLNSASLPLHTPWALVPFQLLALPCSVLHSVVTRRSFPCIVYLPTPQCPGALRGIAPCTSGNKLCLSLPARSEIFM